MGLPARPPPGRRWTYERVPEDDAATVLYDRAPVEEYQWVLSADHRGPAPYRPLLGVVSYTVDDPAPPTGPRPWVYFVVGALAGALGTGALAVVAATMWAAATSTPVP